VSEELRLEGPCHECGGVGPVVIVQSDTDPGDIGEPRIVYNYGSDQETVVVVPSFSLWPDPDIPTHEEVVRGNAYRAGWAAGYGERSLDE
jgi:hypothetical protein